MRACATTWTLRAARLTPHSPHRRCHLPTRVQALYEKLVVFYELDLGLNHVVRKWSDAVDPTANKLVAVPGGTEGPGGVIVCSENFIVYKSPAQPERRCALPRRKDLPAEHGLLLSDSTEQDGLSRLATNGRSRRQ